MCLFGARARFRLFERDAQGTPSLGSAKDHACEDVLFPEEETY